MQLYFLWFVHNLTSLPGYLISADILLYIPLQIITLRNRPLTTIPTFLQIKVVSARGFSSPLCIYVHPALQYFLQGKSEQTITNTINDRVPFHPTTSHYDLQYINYHGLFFVWGWFSEHTLISLMMNVFRPKKGKWHSMFVLCVTPLPFWLGWNRCFSISWLNAKRLGRYVVLWTLRYRGIFFSVGAFTVLVFFKLYCCSFSYLLVIWSSLTRTCLGNYTRELS